MILAVSLVVLLFASDASCQTVVTYSSKSSEGLLCPITDQTVTATWTDETTKKTLANYVRGGEPDIIVPTPDSKHTNFMYSVNTTTFMLLIQDVEAEDGGDYACNSVGGGPRKDYIVFVEVIPGTFSLDCYVPPDITCPEQGVNPPSKLVCVCAANGVHPGTLYLDIPGADTPQQNERIENGTLFDLRLKATVPVTESMAEVTCSVKGYNTTEPIPSKLITKTFMISPPTTCSLDISFDQECKVATLTCSCTASPTDGESPSDKGMVYSYFNGTGHMIESATTNTVQTNDVAAGAVNTYSCRGCNGIYYGDTSNVTKSSECTISTTALPTTTIVTTAPLSTNEPTSTKATDASTSTMHTEDSTTESTTEKSESTTTKKPGPRRLTPGAITGIIVGVLAVVIVIVVIAVIMYKTGKCGSNSSSSSVTDVKVTATNSHTTNSEPAPAPVYGEIKKDRKKKSDKLDDNGAGPRGDPEIPAYGVVDKNRTKDPTPAPRSSMRDSTNPSKPKQDGQMEMQYADLDHGNKPPSDEVRKPKEEPTEYATVQSVIV